MPLESTEDKKLVEASLSIPFATSTEAEIAYKVLSVDNEPRRNFVEKNLTLNCDHLLVHFKADQVKNLRTAITSFFEALLLCTDTLREFGTQDAGTHTGTNSA